MGFLDDLSQNAAPVKFLRAYKLPGGTESEDKLSIDDSQELASAPDRSYVGFFFRWSHAVADGLALL